MNKILKLNLIQEAQKYLVNNPQNLLHDITHHYRVLQLAHEVIEGEKLDPDYDVLAVICWWHDVKLPGVEERDGERVVAGTAKYLKEKFDKPLDDKIYDSVVNHEFKLSPEYLEGKILQDADKLDILFIPRLDLAIDGVEAGLIEKDWLRDAVIKVLEEEWLSEMIEQYNYDFSKKLHRERLPNFNAHLSRIKKILI